MLLPNLSLKEFIAWSSFFSLFSFVSIKLSKSQKFSSTSSEIPTPINLYSSISFILVNKSLAILYIFLSNRVGLLMVLDLEIDLKFFVFNFKFIVLPPNPFFLALRATFLDKSLRMFSNFFLFLIFFVNVVSWLMLLMGLFDLIDLESSPFDNW